MVMQLPDLKDHGGFCFYKRYPSAGVSTRNTAVYDLSTHIILVSKPCIRNVYA